MPRKNFIIAPHVSFLGVNEPDDIIQEDIQYFINYLSFRSRDISTPSQDKENLSEKEVSDFFDRMIKRVKSLINRYNRDNTDNSSIYVWLDHYTRIENLKRYIDESDFQYDAPSINEINVDSPFDDIEKKQIIRTIDEVSKRIPIDEVQAILIFDIATFEKDAPLTFIYPGDLD